MNRRFVAGVLVPGTFALALLVIAVSSACMASGWTMGDHMQQMHSGADTSDSALVSGGMTQTVDIRDFAFEPGNLQVPAGATVTWTNYDSVPHSATGKDGGDWDTGLLSEGESASITFDEPGEYLYYCIAHPQMVARLTVGDGVN